MIHPPAIIAVVVRPREKPSVKDSSSNLEEPKQEKDEWRHALTAGGRSDTRRTGLMEFVHAPLSAKN